MCTRLCVFVWFTSNLHIAISLNPMTQLDRLIGGVNRYAFTLKHIIASANTSDGAEGDWLEQFFSHFRQIYVIARVGGFLAPRNSTILILKNLTDSRKCRARVSRSSWPSVHASSWLFGLMCSTIWWFSVCNRWEVWVRFLFQPEHTNTYVASLKGTRLQCAMIKCIKDFKEHPFH